MKNQSCLISDRYATSHDTHVVNAGAPAPQRRAGCQHAGDGTAPSPELTPRAMQAVAGHRDAPGYVWERAAWQRRWAGNDHERCAHILGESFHMHIRCKCAHASELRCLYILVLLCTFKFYLHSPVLLCFLRPCPMLALRSSYSHHGHAGLTSLTSLSLLGGEMEGEEVLDAAAKASSLVSSRSASRGPPLPKLHLKCVGECLYLL